LLEVAAASFEALKPVRSGRVILNLDNGQLRSSAHSQAAYRLYARKLNPMPVKKTERNLCTASYSM
jgi:hypothetical protein